MNDDKVTKITTTNILIGKGVKLVLSTKDEYTYEVTQKALEQIIRKGYRFEYSN